ncbi:MAG: 5-(carboxyamino)imidazole ribonucleotide synthase [Phycisphaerae bacterium]
MSRHGPIQPGATLGVFGGGQLGRMFCQAAAQMGYRTVVFSPKPDSPAAQVAWKHVRAEFEDEPAVRQFASQCDAVTIEFENVPVKALCIASELTVVRPGPALLAVCQDRLRERAFLQAHHLPVAHFRAVHSAADARRAVQQLAAPVVLKSARFGYDGRGQVRVDRIEDAEDAWVALNVPAALAEAWVDYQLELSVLLARSADGQIEVFGPIENDHSHHILDVSVVPARVPKAVAEQAIELAKRIASDARLIGLICAEMFLTADGKLLINELAPRPHNSGHLTIEACSVSQFQQQVRALCNLPLGKMHLQAPTAMANLLGDLWPACQSRWHETLACPNAWLHLYGKTPPRPGRKMGHLTVRADSADAADQKARLLRDQLTRRDGEDTFPDQPQICGWP